ARQLGRLPHAAALGARAHHRLHRRRRRARLARWLRLTHRCRMARQHHAGEPTRCALLRHRRVGDLRRHRPHRRHLGRQIRSPRSLDELHHRAAHIPLPHILLDFNSARTNPHDLALRPGVLAHRRIPLRLHRPPRRAATDRRTHHRRPCPCAELRKLGDDQERVPAAELTVVFAIFVVVVLGGLLLGFWLKEKSARALWFTTLAIAVASFIAFAIFSRHPCSYEEWHWSSKAAHLTLS